MFTAVMRNYLVLCTKVAKEVGDGMEEMRLWWLVSSLFEAKGQVELDLRESDRQAINGAMINRVRDR
jgi:hypothetical protein